MSILNTLYDDMKAALKAGDKSRLAVIRLLINALKQETINDNRVLDHDGEIAVLNRAVKQRREAIEEYRKGGRLDMISSEEFEITVIEHYLPQKMSEAELGDIIRGAIARAGAVTEQDFGRVMKEVMGLTKGRSDGKTVQTLVKAALAAGRDDHE